MLLHLYPCATALLSIRYLPAQTLTILLLISWKWISQTFSTMSSLSNVTKPNPEEKAKPLGQARALQSSHPSPAFSYWQEKRRSHKLQGQCNQPLETAVPHLPSPATAAFVQKTRPSLTDCPFLLFLCIPPPALDPTVLKTKCFCFALFFNFAICKAKHTPDNSGEDPSRRSHKRSW